MCMSVRIWMNVIAFMCCSILRWRYAYTVVGDSLGDTHMADGVNHDALLRIGLCNRVDVEEDGSLRLLV